MIHVRIVLARDVARWINEGKLPMKLDPTEHEIPNNVPAAIENLAREIRIIDMYSRDLADRIHTATSIEIKDHLGTPLCNWESQRLGDRVIPDLIVTMQEARALRAKEIERLTKVLTGAE